jgi:hypothetical protein
MGIPVPTAEQAWRAARAIVDRRSRLGVDADLGALPDPSDLWATVVYATSRQRTADPGRRAEVLAADAADVLLIRRHLDGWLDVVGHRAAMMGRDAGMSLRQLGEALGVRSADHPRQAAAMALRRLAVAAGSVTDPHGARCDGEPAAAVPSRHVGIVVRDLAARLEAHRDVLDDDEYEDLLDVRRDLSERDGVPSAATVVTLRGLLESLLGRESGLPPAVGDLARLHAAALQ